MFAVVRTGGKQYRVEKDQVITVERLVAEPGAELALEDVLMVGDESGTTIGTPVVADARVRATVVEQTRGEKIIVFKKIRRQNHRRKNGHRQDLTVLRILDIEAAGKSASAAPAKKKATRSRKKADEAAPAAASAAEAKE